LILERDRDRCRLFAGTRDAMTALDVVGIDLSPNMIAEARRLNPGLRFELLTGVTVWADAKLGTRGFPSQAVGPVGRHAEYRRQFVRAHGRRGP
jgi:hypothetical protein